MTKQNEERRFGNRMDAASDKQALIEAARGYINVLDLGAGTGMISRAIAAQAEAEDYECHVDAVDLAFKNVENCVDTANVSYYGQDIKEFLRAHADKRYDCIILSALLHELTDSYIAGLIDLLGYVMADNCRILIREPFYNKGFGPIGYENQVPFIFKVEDRITAGKAINFFHQKKLSDAEYGNGDHPHNYLDWLNLCFTLSYGEDSWAREQYELRYARTLGWCKSYFDFEFKPYHKFEAVPVLDKTYRDHFIKAGIPGEAFDLIKYTGMLVIIDY